MVLAVRRGDRVLRDDESIGTLWANDRIEFAPLIKDAGHERVSWVTSDAKPDELRPVEGEWTGAMPGPTLFRMYTSEYAPT